MPEAENFVCSDCTRPGPDGGDCPCGAGPRLNLGDPQVVEMLVETDDRAVEKTKQRNLWLGVGAGLGLVVAILFTVPQVILAIPLPLPFANPIKIIGLMILIAAGASKAADALLPAKRKFPQLKAVASARNPDLARMRQTSNQTWIAIAAGVGILFLAGVAITVVKGLAGEPKRSDRGALTLGEEGELVVPGAPKERPLFRDSDFPILSRGILTLRGKVVLGEGREALLYRAPAGHLVACEIRPDDKPYVDCSEPQLPVKPQTARLVRGKDFVLIHGVTAMGESPEETEHGVFDLEGKKFEEEVASSDLAPDRPQLPPPSKVWFQGTLGEAPLKLERVESGDLRLTVGSEAPVLVMKEHDAGGPATGMPITFKGSKAVLVLFQNKQGLGALRLDARGELEPVSP